jgi:hypothetical protein
VDEIPAPPGDHPGVFNYDTDDDLKLQEDGLNHSDPMSHSAWFDGGYVSVDNKPEIAPGDFSIELLAAVGWDKEHPQDLFVRRVVAASLDPDAGTGWSLFATDDGEWQGEIWAGAQSVLTPAGPIAFNEENHLVLTYSQQVGQEGQLTLWVDGEQFGVAVSGYTRNATQPLCIGTESAATPRGYHFKGRVQEVALYNVALRQGQVEAHYHANGVPTDSSG